MNTDTAQIAFYLECERKAKNKKLHITASHTDFILRDEFHQTVTVVRNLADLRRSIRDYVEPKGHREARAAKGSGVKTGDSIKRKAALLQGYRKLERGGNDW